jgi:hypothetical protein
MIEETQWPNLIVYTAVLEEAIQPTCKVTIDDIVVNKSIITITPEKPRLHMQNLTFANSSEIFFSGWNSPEYNFTGYIPEVSPSGSLASKGMTKMINALMDGRVSIGKIIVKKENGESSNNISCDMFSDLFVDSSTVSVSPNETDQGTKISFNAKE